MNAPNTVAERFWVKGIVEEHPSNKEYHELGPSCVRLTLAEFFSNPGIEQFNSFWLSLEAIQLIIDPL